ncbi:MAG: hypothetical protein WAO83_20440 [Fuerstiella sp.]
MIGFRYATAANLQYDTIQIRTKSASGPLQPSAGFSLRDVP